MFIWMVVIIKDKWQDSNNKINKEWTRFNMTVIIWHHSTILDKCNLLVLVNQTFELKISQMVL